ncbi:MULTISPECIES: carbamoyltransferase HypF [Haloarcula]|uniref:carbamoyltransferase HypF n=1 Tax=Haloarcula TaxID=2237 RepID=UPI0023ED293B|nr:carbamoyltransferase HypF [Halomicroarcula sp. XH51]
MAERADRRADAAEPDRDEGPASEGESDGARDADAGPSAVAVGVTGTVQGVGFRPFVARTAGEHGVAGRVKNADDGVRIVFEGAPGAVEEAVETVRTDPPPLATVDDVTVADCDPAGHEQFEIVPSTAAGERATLVPPDTGICADCRADIRAPDSRYHGYWATACVNCGPRFAITEGLPYDRKRTAMSDFRRCPDCQAAYESPTDRRFHAQTVACPACGPTLTLVDGDGTDLTAGTAALSHLADRLAEGEVAGLKGAGGCHLCCRATDADAVGCLRERTGRDEKPFAVMAPSVERVEAFARVDAAERESLTDARRPIVVLDRRTPAGDDARWLEAVAPGLHTVGVMLPYSGVHHLLFDRVTDPLVMTSANRPGEPMCTTRTELLDLSAVDCVLVHDRDVTNRCDDSVVRHVDGDRRFLRRSRGWVPDPLPRPVVPDLEVLGAGGRSDVTVALTDGDRVVPSQHVGTVTDPATARFHRRAAAHLSTLLDVDPDVVAHDLHPEFRTRAVAETVDARSVGVWHHHAHAAALLAEHDRSRAVVIAADGTGYGPDGVVRGGEVLDSRLARSDRVGGLSEFRLPGGERAVREPARVLADLLDDERRVTDLLVEHGIVDDRTAAATIHRQAARKLNSPVTTSAGRFLDATSALLGLCTERSYRGQPARRLEAVAARGDPHDVDPPVDRTGVAPTVRADRALEHLAALSDRHAPADVAATAQRLLADGLAEIAVDAAQRRGLQAVGFTGGVAYNPAISARIREAVTDAGLAFLGHAAVPPGDGGLSYGQAVAVSARAERGDLE